MKVTRRALGIGIAAVLGVPLTTSAQAPARRPRIGVLESWARSAFPDRLAAFQQGLRDLGYVGARAVLVEYRSANGKVSDLPGLAADLVRLKVDVIFARTTSAAIAARDATPSIPIVMAVVADPIGVRLVSSLARPGGNVTGLTTGNVEVVPKKLELLREIAGSKASRAAILYHPGDASNVLSLRSAQDAARVLGIELRALPANSAEDFDLAFSTIAAERIGGLLVSAGALTDSHVRRIVELAASTRVPAMYSAREFVEAGGLVSYSVSFTDNYRRAASYVDKILKGVRPADLPVEQASKFEFVINVKVARALGLAVSPSLLLRADLVLE